MHRRTFLKNATAAWAPAVLGQIRSPSQGRRIAFGGIQIECSTYGHNLTRLIDFQVLRGKALADNPFFASLKNYPWPFQPTLLAQAVPGDPVERGTYSELKAEFLERLKALLPLDGVYLAMHGAMYVEGMQDAEGDWIAATRELVGKSCLLTASFDLHGNLSRRVIDNLDMLSAFRTAPHIDREETMRRSCDMLVNSLNRHIRPTLVWAPIPVLLPGERTSTVYEPAKRLWGQLPAMNADPSVMDASLMVGYVWADEPRATASAILTGTDRGLLERHAMSLAQSYWDARTQFRFGVFTATLAESIEKAKGLGTKPVVISDSGDNPTGGGTGDRAEVVAALLQHHVKDALVAGIADRPATDACYRAGRGAVLQLRIGGTIDPKGNPSFPVTAKVMNLLPVDNPLERQAVVDVNGITAVLTARRRPFHEIKDFSILGLDPTRVKILIVKAGYLVPEIAAIANPNLMALTGGAVNQDIEHLESRHRVPSWPFQPDLQWKPSAVVSARS
ncbi:MAG: M81 family metallopeptidase [Bryobacteraceae bacterium]